MNIVPIVPSVPNLRSCWQLQRDEPSSVSTWRRAALPSSEPNPPSTVASTPHTAPSRSVEKVRAHSPSLAFQNHLQPHLYRVLFQPSHPIAPLPTDTPSARSLWRSKMLPESDTQSNATLSTITSIPVPIEYRAPPPRSTASVERV